MRRTLRSRARLCAAFTVAGLTVAVGPAAAQEDVPPDTAAAPDTVAAPPDTLIGELPGILTGVLADSAPDSAFAVLAAPIAPEPTRLAGDVIVWDRERIRRSNAMNLGELLAEMAPGSLLLRAGFFDGPIHLVDGPFGPTALDLRIDGRPVLPLIGAQPDLSQFLLAMVDEVRVRRLGSGLRVDITTLRRTDRRAYSRIEAGSGDPGLESLRLVFTNGIGSSFAATAGFELLDVADPETDLQGFSGGLAWLPGGGSSGVELQYEQRSFDRTVPEPRTGSRSRLVLGGRTALTEHIQVGAWLGESFRELDPPVGEAEEEATGRRDGAAHGGVELRGVWDRGWGSLGALFTDDPSLPARELELEGGFHPTGWLTVDAGGRLGAHEPFDTHGVHAGAAAQFALAAADLRLHGRAASGLRGASYLAADSVPADSVGFDVLAGGVDVQLGSFLLGGRVARQEVNRQIAFGTGFDQPGSARAGTKVIAYEVIADVPVLPLSWLLGGFDPVRVRGFFRHNQIESGAAPLYVPANITRGELYFEDSFLEGDLGVRLALGLDRRDSWLAAPTTGDVGGEAPAIPARSSLDFDLGLRIVGVLIFWRVDNIESALQQDLPALEYPVRRQVFGIRWAFYN